MVEICPRCQSRFTRMGKSGDFVHQCNSGNATLDQEDVPVLGNFTDYTGSGSRPKFQVLNAGLQNSEQGTDGGVRGAKAWDRTVRGKRAPTHRQRQRLQYIE